MARRLRIAFGRISHETHALSPVPTTRADFERFQWIRGEVLRDAIRPWRPEAPTPPVYAAELTGLWTAARADGAVELVPLLSAWAIPSGKIDRETYDALTSELLDGLRAAGPLDGVFLVLHGAMGVHGVDDPEGELLDRVRALVGPARIAVVYDLHAILTRRKAEVPDLVFGYRTNPHRDHFAIGLHAARRLLATLRGRLRPHLTWRSLPMVLGGAPAIDVVEPLRSVLRTIRREERAGRIASASVFQSQLWHDSPEGGWAVVVLTDADPETADAVADALADALWASRDRLPDDLPSVSEAIATAREARLRRWLGTVCLSDASDMVACGSVGENTAVVEALLREASDLRSFAPVRDAVAVEATFDLPDGAPVALDVGGRLAPEWYRPLHVRGRKVRSVRTAFWGRAVVLDLGPVTLVVTEHAPMTVSPAFYREVGLSPLDADICVVKSLFLFRLYFLPYNRLTLFARTCGMTDFDVYERLTYDRPVHPKDAVTDWRPGDAARRGTALRPAGAPEE